VLIAVAVLLHAVSILFLSNSPTCVVQEYNMASLKQAVLNGADKHPGATQVLTRGKGGFQVTSASLWSLSSFFLSSSSLMD
jgi:hypothetical protein